MKIIEINATQTWPIRQEVMWPNEPISFVKLDDDMKGIHFGLYIDEKLISVISLFITGASAQFRKFATLPSHQGKGLGTHLLNHVLTYASVQNIQEIWCNARTEKASFYERFGMKSTKERFMKKGQEYVIMKKTLNAIY